ncbi:flagellin [Ruegeria sp. HKCCD8929]|uniref:flagellin n=1 Tax=Ruegeria sp. HKCCD8929 TaxID=2683006 RepID=UPI0014893AF5|nr:flagellin [Ruegeria sp. HKCCD8929]
MALNSIGDLARGLMLQTRSTQIKTEIETLSYELSSGQVANVAERLGGDYAQIADIDRSLARLDGFSIATSEAGLFANAMQISLTTFDKSVAELSSTLLAFGTSNQAVTQTQASVQAADELDTMISALNTRVGGRSLFAGTATDATPLASPDTLLTALRAEFTGLTTASDILQAAETWFNDPAGFEAVMYQGSADVLAPMQISEREQVRLPLKADDQAFRDALRSAAVAALASDPTLAMSPDQRTALFKELGGQLVNSKDDMVQLRAQIGAAEARIDQAATRNSAAKTSLEYSKGELIGADPYETATRLQTVQFQLESLYSVTVRNANLSLVNFLR